VKSRSSGGISRDNSQGSYDLIAQRLTVATFFVSAVIRLVGSHD